MLLDKDTLILWAIFLVIYWSLIGIGYATGAWPVMSIAVNLATGAGIHLVDLFICLFLLLPASAVAAH